VCEPVEVAGEAADDAGVSGDLGVPAAGFGVWIDHDRVHSCNTFSSPTCNTNGSTRDTSHDLNLNLEVTSNTRH